VDALYLADSEETAWGEWYRHLAERAIPPLAQMPRDLWTWQVDIEVADLSTAERLAAVGLPSPEPGRRSWPAFQQLGERLWKDGWPGLLAPSAAHPEGRVLCLFRSTDGARGAKVSAGPRRVSEPPAPPTGLRTRGGVGTRDSVDRSADLNSGQLDRCAPDGAAARQARRLRLRGSWLSGSVRGTRAMRARLTPAEGAIDELWGLQPPQFINRCPIFNEQPAIRVARPRA